MNIFKKIDDKKWNSKYKNEAEKYDKGELKYAKSYELELTTERLRKIAFAKNACNK